MPIIDIKNLTKYYGKARGVLDLNLTVNEGDIFGFIGPNGAGKSTTIRSLLGLITPTSGGATIFGFDCTKKNKAILSDIGYMPSETSFWAGMRVNEIIDLSAKLHKKDCKKEASILCEVLQLDKTKRVEELSLGNRKKVSIVCALQHKPSLYILDEPTSGLDPLIQKEFWKLLHDRHKEGATIFLSSHVLSEIQRYCSNAAIIRDGKLLVSDLVTSLSNTSAKRVMIHGITNLPDLSGVKDITIHDTSINFLYQGEIRDLISMLHGLPISDMTISEPDLEEIFLHYYEKEGKSNDII